MLTRAREANREAATVTPEQPSSTDFFDISQSQEQGTGDELDVRTEFMTTYDYIHKVEQVMRHSNWEMQQREHRHASEKERIADEANEEMFQIDQQHRSEETYKLTC